MELLKVGLIGLCLMLFFGIWARLLFGQVISLENITRKLIATFSIFTLIESLIVLFSYWLLNNGHLYSPNEFAQIIIYLSMGFGFISIFWYSYKHREEIYKTQRESLLDDSEEEDENEEK